MISCIRLVLLRAAFALVIVASAGAVMTASPAEAESQASSPAASSQNEESAAKGAMKCCKLGKSLIINKNGAMDAVNSKGEGRAGTTRTARLMQCCKLGMREGASRPRR